MGRQGLAGDMGRSMSVSDVRQRAGQSPPALGPSFDLLASKVRRPLMRPGTVRRSLLIERLVQGDSRPVVSVVAPPGYGKTTLLSQWADRKDHAFAWVSVDETDKRPEGLAPLRRGGARCGRADRRPGVRRAGLPGQLGARLGRAQAGLGVFVDDLAGGAGPG